MDDPRAPSDSPAPSSAEASGRALLGVLRSIKERAGPEGLGDVIAAVPGPTREILRARVRASEWYPYPAFVALLRSAERVLAPGDRTLCRELGAMGGKRDIGTAFRVFAAIASPERLIRACHRIWPAYYRKAGTMEARDWRPERTVLRISGFREMHPSHCRLMEGWMIATMTAIGCRVADDARESACTSRGAEFHEFECSWSREAS